MNMSFWRVIIVPRLGPGEAKVNMVDTTTKVCRICAEPKTITEFRPRSHDGSQRQSECRTCHNESERIRRAAKTNRKLQAFVTALAARRDADRIVGMAKIVVRSFGGLDEFAREWNRQQKRAMTESPVVAYRYLTAALRLMELASRFER